jgi:hypothetical protein
MRLDFDTQLDLAPIENDEYLGPHVFSRRQQGLFSAPANEAEDFERCSAMQRVKVRVDVR